ncbi:hypothetical protein [Glycomyces sp. MUSA5-2]|uniref:hypothetical protein n=1 Tax=Glycomyces sp. MUSA5-2 TaxID=2053002 RepID=UPI00300833DE
MSYFARQLGDAPAKPEIDTSQKSAAGVEDAIAGFETAYLHGTIAYLLRKKDDENGGVVRLPREVEIANRAVGGLADTACEYAGKEYLYVSGSEGAAILEEAKGYASERLGDIKEKARSFSQQDPEGIQAVQDALSQFSTTLQYRMPMDQSDQDLLDLKSYVAEEYWDEELARMFRKNVVNQIPNALAVHYNLSVFLGAQMQAYREIVETTWKSIYTAFATTVDAYFVLAEESAPSKSITYAQLTGLVGPALKSAFESLTTVVDIAKEGATVLSSSQTDAPVSGSTSADLREDFLAALNEMVSSAETHFEALKTEIAAMSASLEEMGLHELSLPSIDSVF